MPPDRAVGEQLDDALGNIPGVEKKNGGSSGASPIGTVVKRYQAAIERTATPACKRRSAIFDINHAPRYSLLNSHLRQSGFLNRPMMPVEPFT